MLLELYNIPVSLMTLQHTKFTEQNSNTGWLTKSLKLRFPV